MRFLLVILDKVFTVYLCNTFQPCQYHLSICISLILRAGLPTTMVYGSTSFVTTAPAPTTAPSPMVRPFRIIAPAPIQQSLPIFTPPSDESECIYEYKSRSHEKQA